MDEKQNIGNTGIGNTGIGNTGNYNTGSWNDADYHVGAFNTIDADTAYYFNKRGLIVEWVNCIKPSFLYAENIKQAYKVATKEDKELLFKLPNFDADIFFEITGIDVREKEIKEMTLAEIEEKLGYAVKVVK